MSLNIERLKKGEEIYEFGYGSSVALTVVSDANRVEDREGWADGWECLCTRDDTGDSVLLFSADGGAYAPHICYRTDVAQWGVAQ